MGYLSDYQIGTTYGGLANLEALTTPVIPPRSTFVPYSASIELGDGTVRGGGWAVATWTWDFLTRAQRDQLRTFCTGKSAAVYIKTRKTDTVDAYQVYTAVMVWPENEERSHGYRLDFTLEFRKCVAYSP